MRSDNQTQSVLITGFGSFPGVARNVSSDLADEVVAALSAAPKTSSGNEIEAHSAHLTVDWITVGDQLEQLHERHRPAFALHLGVCNTLSGLSVETQAHNACSHDPDVMGCTPQTSFLQDNGPETRATRLPVSEFIATCVQSGISMAPSDDAGRYLCNAAYYQSLALADVQPHRCDALFVHLPQALTKSDPAWPAAIDSLVALVHAAVDHQTGPAANLNLSE